MPQSTHATPDQCDQTQNVHLSILDLARVNKNLQMQHDNDTQNLLSASCTIDRINAEKASLANQLMAVRDELDRRNAVAIAQPSLNSYKNVLTIFCFTAFLSFATGFVSGCMFGGVL